MRDKRIAQALPALGGLGAGAAVALAGLLLFSTAHSGDWRLLERVPVGFPTAVGVAMVVFGAFLLAQHSSGLARLTRGRAPERYFDGLADPMFVTDLDGALRSQNAAAGPAVPGGAFLEPWVA